MKKLLCVLLALVMVLGLASGIAEGEKEYYGGYTDTIDATIVEHRGIYYAVIKDERWPRTSSTGKTIRIAQSKHLTGPYSNPGPPVTPAWREAPTVVPQLKGSGWSIYAEEYPQRYNLFQAPSLSSDTWMPAVIEAPERGRHGCVIEISKKQYKHLLKVFP